ncbi:MAG TPA: signal peptidase I [Candidatus Fusicatenibacter intestinigallinarum]|uniref:Signal peptidase I n=1 Tax=Candidatus Fusicatenibacter intestinigallinarum TaxID=2838598 RepID=A0A9D2SMN3_9FIRM|nr:signal peptidase I [Candidatus Fusicatenibacter intestinigallinarum]
MSRSEQREIRIPSREEVAKEREKLKYRQRFRRTLLSTVGFLIVVAAVSVLISTQFFPVVQVSGDSMEPVLKDGEILVLQKTDDFETGDPIAFYYQSRILLKRVIGTAGDYIDIDEEGNVYVNGELLDEPYVTDKSLGECDIQLPCQVPDGKLFVMGDHRSVSIDSRSSEVGFVGQEQIVGRVAFRVWPLNRLGFVS